MNSLKISFVVLILAGFAVTGAGAKSHTAEERGKALFNNPGFASGKKACSTCHPDGKGIEKAGDRKDLADAVNGCIVGSIGGKAIDVKSQEMQDMIAYIKSLKK